MRFISTLIACLFLVGCTDHETQTKLASLEAQTKELKAQAEKLAQAQGETSSALAEIKAQTKKIVEALPRADRYRMFNGTVGGGDLAFLYDTQTGRVWRYYRNWSANRKEVESEGFAVMFDPAREFSGRAFEIPRIDTSDKPNLSNEFTAPAESPALKKAEEYLLQPIKPEPNVGNLEPAPPAPTPDK